MLIAFSIFAVGLIIGQMNALWQIGAPNIAGAQTAL